MTRARDLSTLANAQLSVTASNLGIGTTNATSTLTVLGNSLFTGILTASTFSGNFIGNGSGLTGITATGSGIVVRNNGTLVGTAATIDFGTNLSVSAISAGVATVTASTGGSGSSAGYATTAGISTNVKGTGGRVLYNSSTDTTTTSSNLTFDGTTLSVNSTPGSNTSSIYLTGTPFGSNTKNGLFGIGQLGFSDNNIIANLTANVNSYAQVILQNLNTGNSASSDFIVNSDSPLGQTYYGDFGINGTAYNGGGPFGDVSGTYLYAAGGTLAVGTNDVHDFRIATGSGPDTPVTRVTVTATSGNTGIGITNPSSRLHVQGDVLVSGVVTATSFSGNITGNLNSTGVSTATTLNTTNATLTNINSSGIATFAGIATATGTLFSKQLNVSGLSTFVGNAVFQSNINIGNNNNLYFGTNNALSISSPGTIGGGGVISGGVNLYDWLIISSANGGNTVAKFRPTIGDGSDNVELYYGGVKKFQTIGAGVTVTGTTFTNQLNVSGVSTLGGNLNVNNSTTELSSIVNIRKASGGNLTAGFDSAGGVTLYYDGSTKLTTQTTGVVVTGGLTVQANGNILAGSLDLDSVSGGNGNIKALTGISTLGRLNVGTGGTVITTTSGGFVGIGTTNPTDAIAVSGKIQVLQDAGSNNRLIFRGTGGSAYRWSIDNYQNNLFRIFREDDATAANGIIGFQMNAAADVLIAGVTTTTLSSSSSPPGNSQMSFALTSNTNLRISVRGTDGVLRTANITLA